MRLVNPMNETPVQASRPPKRLATLSGKTVGLLDISKPGGSVFLDRLEELLKTNYGVTQVIRAVKPTFAKPAPESVLEQMRPADAVIEALAD